MYFDFRLGPLHPVRNTPSISAPWVCVSHTFLAGCIKIYYIDLKKVMSVFIHLFSY